MVQSAVFKTQIALADYPYQKDIENRVLISSFTPFEIDVLREILHDSLSIVITQLADNLDVELEKLLPALERLSSTKLFKINQKNIVVDKEIRKYYEFKMEQFEEGFEPNFEYLQTLLNKVPLPTILMWYTIPRSSDNIFKSIIEQCFNTPTLYRQYLSELKLQNKITAEIAREIHSTPGFQLCAQTVMKKYDLTQRQFEEHMLVLEFNLVCCSIYRKQGPIWKQIITPFSEWFDFVQFEATMHPPAIADTSKIKVETATDFGLLRDMAAVLKANQNKKVPLDKIDPLKCKEPAQLKKLEAKLKQLGFVKSEGKFPLVPTEKGLIWLTKSIHDQAVALANDAQYTLEGFAGHELWNPRNLRLIEKSLKRLKSNEWVLLEDFMKGFIAPIGDREQIQLQRKGKKWFYGIPQYSAEEMQFIRQIIIERFAELGIVQAGQLNGKPCFCLTLYGAHLI